MNDLDLWREMKQGNRKSFELIYRNQIKALYAYGSKISRDSSLVEDCIHDLFVDIWNKRSSIGETDSIIRYLITSLRRRIYRKLKSKSKTTLHEDLQIISDEQLFFWPEEGHLMKNKEKMQMAIKGLTPNQQEVIYLKYFQGLDYEEISEVLDMKYQSVRNLVHRAITKLRSKMTIIFLLISLIIEYKLGVAGLVI